MNHGQQTGEMALSGTREEQPEVQMKIKQMQKCREQKGDKGEFRAQTQFLTLFDQFDSMPTDREEVNREPLTPPKVERATEMGMIHDMTPSSFSPNV